MLLQSDRHTRDDLRIWKELENADLVRKVDMSVAVKAIVKFATRPCYCSVSWGKDSVVVAYFVACYARQVPLIWVRPEGAAMPECEQVRDVFCDWLNPDYREVICPADIWNDESVSNDFAFRPAQKEAGTKRRIVGVRADESGLRTLSRRHHGIATDEVCRPIIDWTNEDVFAFCAQHDLPLHPAYAMLGGGRFERRHRRVASLGGPWADSFGRNEWEREYYGDVLNRMEVAKCSQK